MSPEATPTPDQTPEVPTDTPDLGELILAMDPLGEVLNQIKSWQGVGGGPVPVKMTTNEVQLMAMVMCPVADIAAFYGIKERQLYRRMAAKPELRMAFEQGRAHGRRILRQKQFQVAAITGDVQMLKWLGQNVLGQSAKHSVVTDDLNDGDIADAVEAEYHEVFDDIDVELAADGYDLTKPDNTVGKSDTGADAEQGFGDGENTEGAGPVSSS